jgi:hypothetical protein
MPPLQIATDSFSRASLGSNWTTGTGSSGGFGIIGSTAVALTSGTATTFSQMYWNANSFNPSQYSQLTISALGNSIIENVIGPAILVSPSAQTCYFSYQYSTMLYLEKFLAGVRTVLASMTYTESVGTVFDLQCVVTATTSIALLVNGVVKLTYTDSSSPIQSGSPGIIGYNYNAVATQFQGTPWNGGNTVGLSGMLPLLGCGQ